VNQDLDDIDKLLAISRNLQISSLFVITRGRKASERPNRLASKQVNRKTTRQKEGRQ
jgi:hypothetical protein